jgi:predicted nucleotidyltransferase
VRELALFTSSLRRDFDAICSDIDLAIVFGSPPKAHFEVRSAVRTYT